MIQCEPAMRTSGDGLSVGAPVAATAGGELTRSTQSAAASAAAVFATTAIVRLRTECVLASGMAQKPRVRNSSDAAYLWPADIKMACRKDYRRATLRPPAPHSGLGEVHSRRGGAQGAFRTSHPCAPISRS